MIGDPDDLLGLHHGMPIGQYHASPGLSCSGMADLARSPAHYYARHLDPARPARKETDSQREGRLMHCALFEPDQFDARHVVGPACRRGTKAWDAWAAGETREVIKPDENAAALAQAAALRALPDIAQLLAAGRPEVSAFAADPKTGAMLRCRPDFVHQIDERRVILLDGKTCGDASPAEFARQIARMGYHRQAAHYSEVYARAAAVEVVGFVFGAVETEWPFAPCAVMLDDESLDRGRAECRRLIDLYAECMASNDWPGYSTAIEPVSLPPWA